MAASGDRRPDRELDELLGVYALDALDADERAEVDDYLERSPRARDELARHLEVASFLGNIGGEAPRDLWDRIEVQLEDRISAGDRPSPSPTPPPLRLIIGDDEVGSGTTGAVGSYGGASGSGTAHSQRKRRRRTWSLAAVGVAAAVTSVLGVTVARQNARIDRLTQQSLSSRRVDSILGAPGTREATLVSSDGRMKVRAVIGSDGEAYLVGGQLPALAPGHTYQLWGIKGSSVLSLGAGLLGRGTSSRSGSSAGVDGRPERTVRVPFCLRRAQFPAVCCSAKSVSVQVPGVFR